VAARLFRLLRQPLEAPHRLARVVAVEVAQERRMEQFTATAHLAAHPATLQAVLLVKTLVR
jgi:hypothetical protein